MGGVGRNIYENLLRLDIKASFATNKGNDFIAVSMLEHLYDLGANIIVNEVDLPTSSFTSLLDENNDYYLSISSMKIADYFTTTFLDTINFNEYDIIAIDANSKLVLDYVSNLNKIIFVDATSANKAKIFKNYLDRIDYLKCSAEEFLTIFDSYDYYAISKQYPKMHIIISNKTDDILYYLNGSLKNYPVKAVVPVSTIGAGDAFAAGLLYGLACDDSIHYGVKVGMKLASLCLESTFAVSDKININILKELENERFK
jgi:pseudouridine kinase